MADPKIVASVVGMLVDDAAKDTVAAAGGNLDAVTLRIREEVKGIEHGIGKAAGGLVNDFFKGKKKP